MHSNPIDTNQTSIAIAEPTAFLSSIFIARVEGGEPICEGDSWLTGPVRYAASTGLPAVLVQDNQACMLLPTVVDDQVTSVVGLQARTESAVGVFEVWEPRGEYSDLQLTSGYFAKLERFQNVSSFVRFEFGTGLPGQAAKLGQAILQDGLSTHPGFLRAAGASAGELQTALGLPLWKKKYLATAVLMSSSTTPLAKRIEVWQPESSRIFRLEGVATADETQSKGTGADGLVLNSEEVELFREVVECRGAVVTESPSYLSAFVGLENPLGIRRVLAVPTYQSRELKSVSLLLI